MWLDLYRKRKFETRCANPSLTSFRDQHNKGLDLQTDDDRKYAGTPILISRGAL